MGDSNLPSRLTMDLGRSSAQLQRDLCQQNTERRGGRHSSLYSSDASNLNASNRADDQEKSYQKGREHLRWHNHKSTEPSTDETDMGDKWSGSDLDDTDSTHHLGMWDGKRGKVSLPNLNEKSTTNVAWIWHTDTEQYLRDSYSPKVMKAKML